MGLTTLSLHILTSQKQVNSSSPALYPTKFRKVIKMLVLVVVMFGLCWLPLHTFFLVIDFNPHLMSNQTEGEERTFTVLFYTAFWLAMSNSCANPIIYGFTNESFRADMASLCYIWFPFCGCLKSAASRRLSISTNESVYKRSSTIRKSQSSYRQAVYRNGSKVFIEIRKDNLYRGRSSLNEFYQDSFDMNSKDSSGKDSSGKDNSTNDGSVWCCYQNKRRASTQQVSRCRDHRAHFRTTFRESHTLGYSVSLEQPISLTSETSTPPTKGVQRSMTSPSTPPTIAKGAQRSMTSPSTPPTIAKGAQRSMTSPSTPPTIIKGVQRSMTSPSTPPTIIKGVQRSMTSPSTPPTITNEVQRSMKSHPTI